jgi:peptidoglycan/LPS O-acetylase OafA/YrhL
MCLTQIGTMGSNPWQGESREATSGSGYLRIPDDSAAWFSILLLMSIVAASISWSVLEQPLNSLKSFVPYSASKGVRKRRAPEQRVSSAADPESAAIVSGPAEPA